MGFVRRSNSCSCFWSSAILKSRASEFRVGGALEEAGSGRLKSDLGRSDLGVGRLMLVQNSRSWSTFVAHSMVGKTTSPCPMMTSLVVVISSGGTASLMSKCSASAGATDGALEWKPDEVREAEQELRASARRRRHRQLPKRLLQLALGARGALWPRQK